MSWYGGWRPYVPVHRRRAQAAQFADKLAKKEKRTLAPVSIAGRTIAGTFWGRAWCENLESYSDFENRLPRGRTYVRNGSVIDLQIKSGEVKALVSGSEVYQVTISIERLAPKSWNRIKKDCAQSIASLIDLLQGRFDEGVMQRLAQRGGGLFPEPKEITMRCSCPDWAGMCKHVAATMYGVGARLDTDPEMLFTLRDVDHLELIGQAVSAENLDQTLAAGQNSAFENGDLGEIFGIDLDGGAAETPAVGKRRVAGGTRGKTAKKSAAKTGRKSAAKPLPPKLKKRAIPAPASAAGKPKHWRGKRVLTTQ